MVVNHEEALELAHIKADESNLARCYIALTDEVQTLRAEVVRVTAERDEALAEVRRLRRAIAPPPTPSRSPNHVDEIIRGLTQRGVK